MKIRASFIILPLLLLAGCAHYAPCVKPTDAPKEGSAYIYGRFKQDTKTPLFQILEAQNMFSNFGFFQPISPALKMPMKSEVSKAFWKRRVPTGEAGGAREKRFFSKKVFPRQAL